MPSPSQPSERQPDEHPLFLRIEESVAVVLLSAAILFAGYWGAGYAREKVFEVWIYFVARGPIEDDERIEANVLFPGTDIPSGEKATLEAHVQYPGAEPYYTVVDP